MSRKKKLIVGCVTGLFAVLLFRLFGPSPAINLSEETTYITTPIAEDGLPDYFEHVRKQAKTGVSPDNNASVLIWQAVGPERIAQKYREIFFDELGVSVPSDGDRFFIPLNDNRVINSGIAWLDHIGWQPTPASDDDDREIVYGGGSLGSSYKGKSARNAEMRLVQLYNDAGKQPWSSSSIPPLSDWVHRNQVALDLAVEASMRPKFYQPMVREILEADLPPLISLDYATVDAALDLSRGLITRAAMHCGHGNWRLAHHDLMACRRLANLVAQDYGLGAKLAAMGMLHSTERAHWAILNMPTLEETAYAEIARDIQLLNADRSVMPIVSLEERLNVLCGVIYFQRTISSKAEGIISFDWNHILREFNRHMDACDDYHQEKSLARKDVLEEQIELAWENAANREISITQLAKGALSRTSRSNLLYTKLFGILASPLWAAQSAETRNLALKRLSRLATALAVHKASTEKYPDHLNQLNSKFAEEVFIDPFTDKAFYYEKREEGYLLYSAGVNSADDQGTSEDPNHTGIDWVTIRGDWVRDILIEPEQVLSEEAYEFEEYPRGDDLVIRLPLPALDLPAGTGRRNLAVDENEPAQ